MQQSRRLSQGLISRQCSKPEADEPRLPLLTGNRNVCTGSYTAEQISKDSYDLVSNGYPRQGGSSPRLQPHLASPRSKVRSHMGEGTKCTELPALANLDAILSEDVHSKAQATIQSLSSAVKLPAVNDREQRLLQRTRRLYGLVRPVREAASLEPTDGEFQEWLTLPSKESKHTRDRSPDGSPRMQPSPGARSQTSTDGEQTSSVCGDAPETVRNWHVLLLGKTFRHNHVEYVAGCLAKVLHLNHEMASAKASEARMKKIVCLHTCDCQKIAFRMGEEFRRSGILVQVTSDLGLPDLDGSKLKDRQPRLENSFERSYTQLFFRAGADRKSDKVSGNSDCFKSSGRLQTAVSRSDLAAATCVNDELKVCAEDPVAAFFVNEQKMAEELERRKNEDGKFQSYKTFRRGARTFSQLVKKHKTEIGNLHSENERDAKPTLNKQKTWHTNAAGEPRSDLWGSVMSAIKFQEDPSEDLGSPRHAPTTLKLSPERKEACQMLRFFVFGTEQLEPKSMKNASNLNPQEQDNQYSQPIGTKDQVAQLYHIWSKLDDDDSGRVDVSEFRAFAEKHFVHEHQRTQTDKLDRPQTFDPHKGAEMPRQKRFTRHQLIVQSEMKTLEMTLQRTDEEKDKDNALFITKLCEKVAHMLLGKKSSFAIEDMMRVIWPAAELPQIKLMKGWCRELKKEAEENRVSTPPCLDNAEIEALQSVFEHFCMKGQQEIKFDVLVNRGLIYEEQIDAFREEWDNDGNGVLDLDEFCDMMCPVGFRATQKSKVGSMPDGRKVVYDDWIDGWTYAKDSNLTAPCHDSPIEEEQQEHLE